MVQGISGFKSDIEAEAGNGVLVLTPEAGNDTEIIAYQAEMAASNEIPGLVRFTLSLKDGQTKLRYNLRGLITLANYLRSRLVTRSRFISIVEQIIDTIIGSKCWFLNDSSFVLDQELIYINPDNNEVALIYLPLAYTCEVNQSFKMFLVNLMISTANLETGDNFVEQVFNLVKGDGMNLADFRKKISGLKSPTEVSLPHYDRDNADCRPACGNNVYRGLPDSPSLGDQQAHPVSWGKSFLKVKNRMAASRILLPALVGLLIVLSVAAAASTGVFGELYSLALYPLLRLDALQMKNQLFIGLLTAAGGGLFLLRLRKSRPFAGAGPASGAGAGEETGSSAGVETGLSLAEEAAEYEETGYTDFACGEWDAGNSDETVLLSGTEGPVLVSLNGAEVINVNRAEFTLGRSTGTCDYILHNRGIGRVHAQIKGGAGAYVIVDLDSKNGTFLNGERLLSNKEYTLQDNDRVRFANTEYLFKGAKGQ